jgi:predicted Fe-Mo cluster-binding NifX family protein
MIVAIAANKNHLKAKVDPHFGRCKWFCLYNTINKNYSFLENTVRENQANAGQEAAELLIGKKIGMAIAGRFGSKVLEIFRKNDIQMVIPETQKTLTEIINQLK